MRARLEALRARALMFTLCCSGLRREEVTALEAAEVLGGPQPSEAEVHGKGIGSGRPFWIPRRSRPSGLVNTRGPVDTRKWVFVSHWQSSSAR
jgi:hypothetical protein